MVKVSVIIPIFNVEDYLKECLDSVVNQTFDDIEIICVNDGSTDKSMEILEEYAKFDDRIKIFNQKNCGQGAARNKGLINATGDYILFVDSDDYIELTAIEELVSLSEKKELDLIIFKLINFEDNLKNIFKEEYHEMPRLKQLVNDNIFDYRDISDFVINMDVTVYTKFYKKELISSIKFNEELIFEDNLFTMEYIFKAQSCYFYDKHLYYRRIRSNSIITAHSKNYIDVIEIFNKINDKLKEYGVYDEFKEKLFVRKVNAVLMRFNLINPEFKELFFNKIQEDFINQKDEYENNINLHLIDSKTKFIFISALNSNNYVEFELRNKRYGNYMDKYNRIKIFETVRIDLKNFGNSMNSIEILDNSDPDSTENYPEFLIDENGTGLMIESCNNSLDLTMKIKGNGTLIFSVKSSDVRDKNNERFPIFIDLTSLYINNKNYISENILVTHDDPYIIKKPVENSEIIKFSLEWLPFNNNSAYFNELKLLNERYDQLSQDYICLKNQNNILINKLKKLNK